MSNKGFWLAAIALLLSACNTSTPPDYPAGGATPGVPSGAPPRASVGVSATARDGNNLISWTAVVGATSYNVYWSTTPGVNKTNGTKLAFANNPQAHTGLTNATPYYYVVTAVGFGGEGPDSAEVTATPVAVVAGTDPFYQDQWHLKNTGQAGASGLPGVLNEDMNVEPVWATRKGTGVRIAVVDDGLEIGHEDLASNIAANSLSYNYVNGGSDPTGGDHGTAVAGIAAARDLNNLGGRGAAPRANLVGYNYLQNQTVSNEADAMTRGSPNVDICTNSWGPPDGNGTLDASTLTWRTAITSGLNTGRSGRGTIYVFAAGNGGLAPLPCPFCIDNSNYDGYANNRGVIAVAAVNDQGVNSSYAEPGANIWISAPGGEFCSTHTITTTDRTGGTEGFNLSATLGDYANKNYTRCMNGTSAATPGVSGVIALMLEANPALGWRDVRLILAETARKNNPLDGGWTTSTTTPPYNFNHKYGFGVVNAQAAVNRLTTPAPWTIVGPELTFTTPLASPNLAIPDFNTTGVSDTITVTGSGITKIEFIEITFSANHASPGHLEITLTSPAGAVSRLAERHDCANSACTAYNAWIFGSARHLGEAADGPWTLTVKDLVVVDPGTFQSWMLKFYGT